MPTARAAERNDLMVEISEADWLKVGLFWMALGFTTIVSPLSAALLGAIARALFMLTIAIHVLEAIYSINLAARAGLDRNRWFWRTLLLGYFSVRRLNAIISSSPTPFQE
jgi:hypothetical protein